MITRGDKKFNCCESLLIRVDNKHELPGFGPAIMHIASNFGGGVAGWGSACGAVTGAAMAIGLIMGTYGTEPPEKFGEKREKMRDLTQTFHKAFEEKWGHINCYDLLGANRRTPEGKKKYEELKAKGETHCEEYVEWTAEKVLELVDT
jgi:C_GCAxxG_C_C family probable redox protein